MLDHTFILSKSILEVANNKALSKELVQEILEYQQNGYGTVFNLSVDDKITLCINFVMNNVIRNIKNIDDIVSIYNSLFLHLEDILQTAIIDKQFYIDIMIMNACRNGIESFGQYEEMVTKNINYAETNMVDKIEIIYQLYSKQLSILVNKIDYTDDTLIEELRVLDSKINSMSGLIKPSSEKIYLVF